MSTEIKKYHVLVYGSPTGYQTNRAQIQLMGTKGQVIAWIRFNDLGMNFESDSMSGDIIRMHLPSTMFKSIIDILRNEEPMFIYFAAGRGFLSTSSEPIGEGEN